MFTRVEIDGFKSFESFALDLNPLSVIVGPNAVGKSNFFDALRLLSRLADVDVRGALQELRGEPHELFRQGPDGPVREMRFAVEVLLDRNIKDPYGETVKLQNLRVRYEVGIERRSIVGRGLERLYVSHESARLIRRKDDRLFATADASQRRALASWAPSSSKTAELIRIEGVVPNASIIVSQDGVQGRPRTLRLSEATTTFLSSVRTAKELPHLFALREELVSLRYLQLDPAAERLPSDILASDQLETNGGNLAAVLARIKAETGDEEQPEGILTDIRRDLCQLVPGVMDLEVLRDEAARQYRLSVKMRDGEEFSSRVLSDGTLRILALLSLLHDPRRRGVVCFEEPENGIHEARIPGLIALLRSFCTDLGQKPEEHQLLTQIIVNTHSPVVMEWLKDEEVIAADMVASFDPLSKHQTRKTRMRSGVSEGLPLGDGAVGAQHLTKHEISQLLRRDKEFQS